MLAHRGVSTLRQAQGERELTYALRFTPFSNPVRDQIDAGQPVFQPARAHRISRRAFAPVQHVDVTRQLVLRAEAGGGEPGEIEIHNIARIGDEDDYMPPPDNKDKIPPLTKDQIGLIRAWIDQGAK